MSFSAPWDRTTKILSCVVAGLVVGIGLWTGSLAAAGLGGLTILLAYLYSPRGYDCADGEITVRRLAGDVHFPLRGVCEVRAATSDDLSGCLRLWGSGGLFGYFGLFRTSRLGRCTWYVTDRSRIAVVTTASKTALFSPDDPDRFIAAVRALATPTGLVAPVRPAGRLIVLIVAAVVVALVALTGSLLYYSPGPPRHTLTGDALTIHDRFYPVTVKAHDVDAAGIRVIDLDLQPEWRAVARTNGFGSLRYRSGWFRAASGVTMRMYRAEGRRLVLLPPLGSGAPILYETPEPPEVFADKVRQAWRAAR